MKKIILGVAAVGMAAGLAACDVDKTKNGAMPDVDVNVSGGQLPEYNVTGPDVKVGTENKVVQVPVVDVKTADEKKRDGDK
jgi:uncharacterized lipoprotein